MPTRPHPTIDPTIQGRRIARADSVDPHAFEYFRRLARARAYIEMNLAGDTSLRKVAREVGMSPAYFSAFFRRNVGVSFQEWRTMLRVTRAHALFEQANCSVLSVAMKVGYSDRRSLERAFRLYTGETPRSFRERSCKGPTRQDTSSRSQREKSSNR